MTNRALCILQNRLFLIVKLIAGFKVEIFPGFAAPVDLAVAVVIGLYLPFELGKERSASASFSPAALP